MTAAASTAKQVVRTVTGDVPPEDVGVALPHEHVISNVLVYWEPDVAPAITGVQVTAATLADVRRDPFAVRSNLLLDDIETATKELRLFADAGGGTIVDATSYGLGRDERAVRLVSEASGVRIVAGCGYYLLASQQPGLDERSERSLADEMIRDITTGIASTGIRAGVIGEVGAGTFPMDRIERKVLRAAARAQAETGAGIVVHPAPGEQSAFEVARVLEAAGARMDKVHMSHLDERFRSSLPLFRRLSGSGCLFGFDTFGREMYWAGRRRQHPSDQQRIDVIVELVRSGLGDQIVLGQDICLRHELATYGGHGYAHVIRDIVPRLRAAGVEGSVIDAMLIATPARFLALPASAA